MVECESSTAMLSEFVNFVLIDTWWNVNQLAEGGVLKKGQGFNRYMVECEYTISEVIRIELTSVLIDTWWNVNMRVVILIPA